MNIYLLLDRSGSMATLWKEAIGSINTYAEKVKDANPRFYLAAFNNTSYDVLRDFKDVWKPLTGKESEPSGFTPLYDATGRMLDRVIADKPEQAVVVIMTDGEENRSVEYTNAAIKARLSEIEKMEIPVVFLGANFDRVYDQGQAMNINRANTVNMTKSSLGAGMDMLAARTVAYASARVAGQNYSTASVLMNFSVAEQEALAKDADASKANANIGVNWGAALSQAQADALKKDVVTPKVKKTRKAK